tara:strand:+ start:1726 stop:1989 length:264 start_codon:yes stop_codon:yes gene_type:complete
MSNPEKRFRVYEGVGDPPPYGGAQRKWSDLPLETVAVGDLIEIPLSDEESGKLRAAISSYAHRIGTKHDKKFSVRRTDYGIGIWRTK